MGVLINEMQFKSFGNGYYQLLYILNNNIVID